MASIFPISCPWQSSGILWLTHAVHEGRTNTCTQALMSTQGRGGEGRGWGKRGRAAGKKSRKKIALFSRTAYARLCSCQSVLPPWEQVSCRDAARVRRNWLLRRRIITISAPSLALWGDEPAGQRSVKLNKRLCFPLRRLRKVASHLLPGSMFWNMSSLWQDLSQGDGRLGKKRHRQKRNKGERWKINSGLSHSAAPQKNSQTMSHSKPWENFITI